MRRVANVLTLLGASILACASGPDHVPTPPGGARAVDATMVLGFHERADAFYQQLIRRRFNALETFNDPFLRRHFGSEDRFFDYYADLAQDFDAAHFERSRPWTVTVEEFVFEGPTRVVVQVRFVGDDDRPLRPDSSVFVRHDVWERREESWWIVPGKL